MSVLGLLEMAAKMAAMERDIEAATQRVIEEAAAYVYQEARALIGTYTAGWPQLGPAAIARHGDTPLLDTGKLRASIGVKIGRHVADIGTNDPVMVYQEFGTPQIPPRPVFGFIAVTCGRLWQGVGLRCTAFVSSSTSFINSKKCTTISKI